MPPDDFVAQEPLALSLAGHISLAMANLRMLETLASLAICDPLTGLFHRRYLEESLEREVRRTARNGMPIGVIMPDVDHFQRFNDPFGPGAGATLLTRMAQLRHSRTRAGGMASRSGGEEYTLVLPAATRARPRGRAAQRRRELKQLQVQYASRVRGPLTPALGVARCPQPGSAAPSLLQAAARALDAAKPGGRDRVAVAPAI
jgi:diguanylate cyclase (GGDEF)-like protein